MKAALLCGTALALGLATVGASGAHLIAGSTDGNIYDVDTSIPGETLLYNIGFGATGLAVDYANGRLYAAGSGSSWNQIAVFDVATGGDITGERFSSDYHDLYGLEFVSAPGGGGRLFSVGVLNAKAYFIEYELDPTTGMPTAVKSALQIRDATTQPDLVMGLAYVPGRDRFYCNQAGNMFWDIDLSTNTCHKLWGLALSGTNGLAYQDGVLYGLSANEQALYPTLVYFDFDRAPYQFLVARNPPVGNGWALSGSTTPTLALRTGACCLPGQDCQIKTQAECAAAGGEYRGEGTTCSPNPCPAALGACCTADGNCHFVSPTQCTALSGVYHGNGSSCTPSPCPPPTGACCFTDGTCQVLSEADCLAASGGYHGNGMTCTPNPCTVNPPILLAGNTDGNVRRIDTTIPTQTTLYYIGFGMTGLAVDDVNNMFYASGGGGSWNQIAIFELTSGGDITGERFSSEYETLYGLEFIRMPDGSGRLFSVGRLGGAAYLLEYELLGTWGMPSAVKAAYQITDGVTAPDAASGLAYVPERGHLYCNAGNNTLWQLDPNTGAALPLFGLGLSGSSGLAYQNGKLWGLAAGGSASLVYFDLDKIPHQIQVANNTQVGNGWALSGTTTPSVAAPKTGACCLPSGPCQVLTAAACATASGSYKGDNMPCTANTCACRGDMNCDGKVDFKDINPFVAILSGTAPCNAANADCNGDAAIDFKDINPFVALLSGGATCN
jgi:hypothetical protein